MKVLKQTPMYIQPYAPRWDFPYSEVAKKALQGWDAAPLRGDFNLQYP